MKSTNNTKYILSIIAVIMLILISIHTVSALGVTPGRIVINFEPGLEKTVTLKILNNEHKEFNAVIFARGELSRYITLKQDSIAFKASEDSKEISYSLKLPGKIAEPGTHQVDIVIRETGTAGEQGEISIGFLVSVASQLYINVPYPGKYIKADLDIIEAEPQEETSFYVPIYNLGEENIEKVKVTVFILDKGKEIASVGSNEKAAKSGERIELAAGWFANVTPGIYRAVAVVDYDNSTIKLERDFFVGKFLLKPLDIAVRNFRLGEIAKFSILVENIANIILKDAYSKILLNDDKGKNIADIKSEPLDVEPLSKKEIGAYWDTENVNKGEYRGKLILGYEDKSSERIIKTTVTENSIKTEIVGITAYAVATVERKNNLSLLWAIIIVLLVANLAWFIYFKKRKSKKK